MCSETSYYDLRPTHKTYNVAYFSLQLDNYKDLAKMN